MLWGYDGWFWVSVVLGTLSCVVCVVQAVRGKAPNDVTQVSVLAQEFFLVVYALGSLVMLFVGPAASGSVVEYWGYLLTALIIPAGTFVWSLVERSSWSNWVLAATGPTIVVMVYRMNFIWYYQ